MKSIVFDGKLSVQERPLPILSGDEAVIRLLKAGICNTDIEITRGYYGFRGVLGHEFVGIVEYSPAPSLVGKRVVGEINAACGRCTFCLKNLQRHCPYRTVLGIFNRDGAFQEHFRLPTQNLHIVPDSISDDEAVFTEPIAAACEVLEQISISAAQRVAVLGDGKLGLLLAMVLSQTGCQLTLIGKHEGKLDLVADYPIDRVMLAASESLEREYDVVVEATGARAGWELALQLLKPRGTLVLKSTFHDQAGFNLTPVVVDEISVVGSRCGRFELALQLLEARRIHPKRLLHHRFPLTAAIEAFRVALRPEVLKVFLEPEK
ncbi:MAG: alcohol dehydrogenase catalytic domain-containing protein [Terriglobia bacterium]